MVGLSRFELLTPRLSSVCSNQLSYRPFIYRNALAAFLFKPALHSRDRRYNASRGLPERLSGVP